MSTDCKKNVAIILGYYNGINFIEEQLNSIFQQTHKNIFTFIFNDDPNDRHIEQLINNYKEKRIKLINRKKNLGFALNFLEGLNFVNNFDYYAFSDQDDIWNKDKIEKSLKILSKIDSKIPSLYFSRTVIVNDANNVVFGISPNFQRGPSFENALLQNIGGGNTMLMNKTGRDLIVKSLKSKIISHDWWTYLIISGANGYIFYDKEPSLRYRQHKKNFLGENLSFFSKIYRIRHLLIGTYKYFLDTNLNALNKKKSILTKKNLKLLNDLETIKKTYFPVNVFKFIVSRLHRQSFVQNIAIIIGLLFKRI
tara:strand:- start:634 stop:1560 length:927 start_codon:yes stop_codon:yes gene_type:complete